MIEDISATSPTSLQHMLRFILKASISATAHSFLTVSLKVSSNTLTVFFFFCRPFSPGISAQACDSVVRCPTALVLRCFRTLEKSAKGPLPHLVTGHVRSLSEGRFRFTCVLHAAISSVLDLVSSSFGVNGTSSRHCSWDLLCLFFMWRRSSLGDITLIGKSHPSNGQDKLTFFRLFGTRIAICSALCRCICPRCF